MKKIPISLQKQLEKISSSKKLLGRKFNEKYTAIRKLLPDSEQIKLNSIVPLRGPKYLLEQLQDYIDKVASSEKDEVYLKQSTYWAKRITWTLMGGVAIGIGWLAIAETEEIIVVQGNLEPINRVIDIQMPIGGVVEKILVKEGQIVEKDEILIELNSKSSESKLTSAKTILDLNEEILKKLKTLVSEGAISEYQYIKQKEAIANLRNDYRQQEILNKYLKIKSPLKGKVFDMKPSGKGFVTQTSEPIMKIVPIENLRAKIEIDSRKIGFVSINQAVDISIDSFPATDFGILKGQITSIGSDALGPNPAMNKGFRFPAKISLSEQVLKLKNGKELNLQSGMSLTANIKLRKVTYLQLMLNTFKDKADSIKEI